MLTLLLQKLYILLRRIDISSHRYKMKGDGHFVAVILVILTVALIGVYFKSNIAQWFMSNFQTYQKSTSEIFSNM